MQFNYNYGGVNRALWALPTAGRLDRGRIRGPFSIVAAQVADAGGEG
jgi:hypothetical protein